jgi:hypothetical protein
MKKFALALLTLSACASAQVRRDNHELRQDANQRAGDQLRRNDDRRDLVKIDLLVARFDKARAIKNLAELTAVDEDLRRYMKQELVESKVEVAEDVREVRQGQQESASDRRELVRDNIQGKGPIARADDRHDLRDDRRDVRDDKRDALKEAKTLEWKKAINADLETLYGKTDDKSLDQKRMRMAQLDRLSRGEVLDDTKELREDRRETREDRREKREDVRQHN